MAQGAHLTGSVTAAAGITNTADIRPSGTDEWIVTNLYADRGMALISVNVSAGTAIEFDVASAAGAYTNFSFKLTNNQYLRVRNTDAANALKVNYDGSYNN